MIVCYHLLRQLFLYDMIYTSYLYLKLTVKNKTDSKIMVALEDASLNDETMQMVLSGAPFIILPSQTGTNSFAFPYMQVSLSGYDEVNKASFRIVVYDESTLDVIEKTAPITVEKNN